MNGLKIPLKKRLTTNQYGIGVPNGEVAKSAAEAEAIAKKIGEDDLLAAPEDIDLARRR
jgi:succinyl-CoA synthetase beta subunit